MGIMTTGCIISIDIIAFPFMFESFSPNAGEIHCNPTAWSMQISMFAKNEKEKIKVSMKSIGMKSERNTVMNIVIIILSMKILIK